MGAQGFQVVDFGAFPGKTDASAAVTGQAGIVASSLAQAEAWPPGNAATTALHAITNDGTADHTGDEHMVEHVKFRCKDVVAGTGFTIYAFIDVDGIGGPQADGQLLYGKWLVFWVWN